jgi:glutamate-ammonia-ligase adenylyltransferase
MTETADTPPRSLADRIAAAPLPYDAACADDALAGLDPDLARGPLGPVLHGAGGSAPYLAGLIRRHGDWLSGIATEAPESTLAVLLAELRRAGAEAPDQPTLSRLLRRAKSRAALLIALADLGGVWGLAPVTAALSDLAETATDTALRWLMAEELRRNRLPGLTEAMLETGGGHVVLAMGKLGARELNYSSDIDLICLFDQDQYDPDDFAEVKARCIHVTRALVKLLSDQTAEGYVFRTDLRLRPAPSTTPVCLAMETAERYYESLGRTWERAAHIKARPIAGDIAAGAAYLDRLTPFVWRRYLDFAAIEDTHDMLGKIRAAKGGMSPQRLPGHDIKLGPGGIREIEFFAQTRQLISGGRDPRLRNPTTLGALQALVAAGHIPAHTADSLSADYTAHRTTEHRLQMVSDAQTQTIPQGEDARARVAALSGWSNRAAWERDLSDRLVRVHTTCEAFFSVEVSPDAEPAETGDAELAALGFARPDSARHMIERWRSGSLPATRTARARSLFSGLEQTILEKLGLGGAPDEALAEFDRFLSGLPAGVQVFSLFRANPHLLDLIAEICATAPRLAGHLGREPQALDALLGRSFFEPLPAQPVIAADLDRWLAGETDYERQLDIVRRWAREQRFRVGVQVLRGLAKPTEAGAVYSAIAQTCLDALLPGVIAEFATRHGMPPGAGLAVIAMGKLGSREMTEGSDLDLIIVYDPGDATASDGPRPLAVGQYYPRLTQALVAALTAPTAEGRLYEVDMRLRPSGRSGPVAVTLDSFRTYQSEKAWVWEHLALTRARVVAGDPAVGRAVAEIIGSVIATRAGQPEVLTEAGAMRKRLIEAHASARPNPWALKHARGGLMEIEFLAQTGVLLHGWADCRDAGSALPRLAQAGWLTQGEARDLTVALRLMQALQQVERVALEKPFDPDTAGHGLRRAMARAGSVDDFGELQSVLTQRQARAGDIVERIFSAASAA